VLCHRNPRGGKTKSSCRSSKPKQYVPLRPLPVKQKPLTKGRAPPAVAEWPATSKLYPFKHNPSPLLIRVRVQSDLLGELKQVLRNAQANATSNIRFQLFFETLHSFFARTPRQVYNLFAPIVGARSRNDLFGRFKRAVRSARVSTTCSARFRSNRQCVVGKK